MSTVTASPQPPTGTEELIWSITYAETFRAFCSMKRSLSDVSKQCADEADAAVKLYREARWKFSNPSL